MLAMSQSGIIENNFPVKNKEQIIPVNVKPVKISTFVLPKRIIEAPSNVLSKRIIQIPTNVLPPRIQLKPLATVKEESGFSRKIIRMKRPSSPGDLEGNSKKLKPMMNNNPPPKFGMLEPVLSQIFEGTFGGSEAFNVQV